MVLCHGYIDFDSPLSGWKWRKTSSNGVWGVHVVDDGKEFDCDRWQQDRIERKRQRQQELEKLAATALNVKERDRGYRKIANYLGLTSRRKQDLLRRGLTEEAIAKYPFFSAGEYPRVPSDIPENLPGVRIDGDNGDKYLSVKYNGYFCPSFNIEGRVNGGQVRYETENNKYRWLKGIRTSHLPNGELPITLVRNHTHSDTLYLSEGFLKPLIASEKLGIDFCGAVGGDFKGSPKQFKETIAHYNTIILCPDAGDILNPQVLNRWRNNFDFLESLGLTPKILWWGQKTKSDKDIDEIAIADFAEAELISIENFIELAGQAQYQEKVQKAWESTKIFTPNITINQQFLDIPCPQDNSIYSIKSGLGTGKTSLLIEWLKNHWKDYGGIDLGYRNTLLIQFCEKSKFIHIHNTSSWIDIADPQARVAACVNSHYRFKPEDFEGKILILDEVVSILKHLLFSSTVGNRGEAIALFIEAIKRAKIVICLDGNLSDIYCDFIAQCDTTKTVEKIENIYQGNKPELVLLEGTIKDEKLRKRDNCPWLYDLLNNPDLVDAIGSDSQIFLESLDYIYQEQGLSTLRVDSKTINDPITKEFLKDPDSWLRKNKINKLLFSPSCESGLDIPIKNYFNRFFGLFFGKLDADSITQLIARLRDSEVTRYLWVTPFVKTDNPDSINSPLLETLQYHYNQRITRDLHGVLSGELNSESLISELLTLIKQSQNSPENSLSQRLQAMVNYEKSHLRDCVYWMLERAGYDVSQRVAPEIEDKFKESSKKIKEEKIAVVKQNSSDIFNASEKYIGKPETMLNFDASWDDRCALIKAKLIDRLPGINQDPAWSEDFIFKIKYKYPNFINQLEDRYLLENLDKSKERSQKIYHSQLVKGRSGKKLTPWKLNPRHQRLLTLEAIGLREFIENNRHNYLRADEPVLTQLIEKCRLKKNWQALGKKPHSDPIKYLRWLLQQVGYGLSVERETEDGKEVRLYSIEFVPNQSLDNLVQPIMKAIAAKYSKDQPVLDWTEGTENVLQESSVLQENGQKLNDHFFGSQPTSKPRCASVTASADVDIFLLEDPQDLTTENILQDNRGEEQMNHHPPGIEETPLEEIAEMFKTIDNKEALHWLVYDSGLSKEQRSLAWHLLSLEERKRLRPLFDQLKAS